MFGFRKRQAADKVAFLLDRAFLMEATFMKPTVGGFMKDTVLRGMERDPYLAGYVGGKFASFVGYFQYKLGLSKEHISEIYVRVLSEIYDGDVEAGKRLVSSIERHRRQNTTQFREGDAKGVRVVSYFVGVHDPSGDPDFQEAMAIVQGQRSAMQPLEFGSGFGTSFPEDSDRTALMDAAMGLETLWFTRKLSDY